MTVDKQTSEASPELPFRSLLYRFLFFDWLFRDVSAARTRIERHAAEQPVEEEEAVEQGAKGEFWGFFACLLVNGHDLTALPIS